LPEINEEFLKSVGNFKTIDDLKARIKDNMEGEKKWRSEEKRKSEILDMLVADTRVEVPQAMIDNELAKMESRIKGDLAQMGVSFDDYLKHMKKDLAAWKESEKGAAKKQVIIQLALHAIGKQENLKVSDEAIGHEVAHLMMQYKDVDKERATAYTEERMNNSFVAEYLFTGKVPDEKELFGSHEGHNH
jgi:trigger factor